MDAGAQSRALDNLTTAVLVVDQGLGVRYVNPAAEVLLESSARRICGGVLTELLPASEDLVERLQTALRDGAPFTERERHLRLPGQRQLTATCVVTPLLEADQPPALLIELMALDRPLRISREEQLLSQQKATRAVLRGLAHEVKNPLGGLRGAAQLLERELGDPELKDYTRIIVGEADRLRNLVDRMVGPNNRARMERLDVHEILEHVRNLVGAEAPSGVELRRDYDPSLPLLWGARDLLTQAVLNIVRNALQAVADQGCITLRTRVERGYTIGAARYRLVAKVDVIDDGPGISADMLERIFFPMVTGREQGRGLGLSIAQELINQHRGLIECSSRPGHTELNVFLPLDCELPDAAHE